MIQLGSKVAMIVFHVRGGYLQVEEENDTRLITMIELESKGLEDCFVLEEGGWRGKLN